MLLYLSHINYYTAQPSHCNSVRQSGTRNSSQFLKTHFTFAPISPQFRNSSFTDLSSTVKDFSVKEETIYTYVFSYITSQALKVTSQFYEQDFMFS